MQHLVGRAFYLQVVLDNRHEAVGDDGHAYLYADSILRGTPEPLDFEVLLQPLVEKLDLPPVLVQVRDLKSRQVEGVREEGEVSVLPVVMVSDQSEFLWILLEGRFLRQYYLGIREHILRESTPPFHAPVLEVFLGSYDEVRVCLVNLEESREGVVSAVEHVIGTGLARNLAHHPGVEHRCLGDKEKGWHQNLQVVQEVNLHAAFALAELGPPEDRQAKRNRRRVERIDVPVQLEDVVYPLPAGLIHHIEGEALKNPIVTVLVGGGKRCLCDRVPTQSEVVTLRLVGFQSDYQVAQAFPIAKLPEHHSQQLVPAGEVLYIFVATILADKIVEVIPVHERRQLCEYELVLKHVRSRL